MSLSPLRIATRQSALALWQAEHVRDALQRFWPNLVVELVPLSTQGDRILDSPLAKIGGKGLFVKELEEAMLDGRADLAVHSMKDVPMQLPEGLVLGAMLTREDPRDAFLSNYYAHPRELSAGARVGTSSLRRQCQLRAAYPGLIVEALRGNVQTRVRKLDEDEYDAILLAGAGLKRLGLADRIRHWLSPEESLPAAGQGAIGIEMRADDTRLRALVAPLDHAVTSLCVRAERALNAALQGGCQVPIGAYAEAGLPTDRLSMRALIGHPDGHVILHARGTGAAAEPESLGRELADDLLRQGARAILDAL